MIQRREGWRGGRAPWMPRKAGRPPAQSRCPGCRGSRSFENRPRGSGPCSIREPRRECSNAPIAEARRAADERVEALPMIEERKSRRRCCFDRERQAGSGQLLAGPPARERHGACAGRDEKPSGARVVSGWMHLRVSLGRASGNPVHAAAYFVGTSAQPEGGGPAKHRPGAGTEGEGRRPRPAMRARSSSHPQAGTGESTVQRAGGVAAPRAGPVGRCDLRRGNGSASECWPARRADRCGGTVRRRARNVEGVVGVVAHEQCGRRPIEQFDLQSRNTRRAVRGAAQVAELADLRVAADHCTPSLDAQGHTMNCLRASPRCTRRRRRGSNQRQTLPAPRRRQSGDPVESVRPTGRAFSNGSIDGWRVTARWFP
jgi:hypothetical protein